MKGIQNAVKRATSRRKESNSVKKIIFIMNQETVKKNKNQCKALKGIAFVFQARYG